MDELGLVASLLDTDGEIVRVGFPRTVGRLAERNLVWNTEGDYNERLAAKYAVGFAIGRTLEGKSLLIPWPWYPRRYWPAKLFPPDIYLDTLSTAIEDFSAFLDEIRQEKDRSGRINEELYRADFARIQKEADRERYQWLSPLPTSPIKPKEQ